jgi:hypothetical protein
MMQCADKIAQLLQQGAVGPAAALAVITALAQLLPALSELLPQNLCSLLNVT